MPSFRRLLWLLPVVVVGAFASAVRADIDSRIQIDARGPLHEAFAQPWQPKLPATEIVGQEPPPPIAEEPPDERPPGQNVLWVPGYWQWDDDRKDFVWVGGFWRDAPEGRRWVMGYWAQTGDGWSWVPGHWAGAPEPDHQFVPPPPESIDQGPSTAAPDADSFYIPGTWLYTDVGYRWRPGYWADCRPGFLWVPARYFWSPGGWQFCNGYWDYAFARRGLLFPPVYFADRAYLAPGFVYRPAVVVGLAGLYGSLFVRTGYGHYYWGDYYGRSYAARGYQPWLSYSTRAYDPLFAHERWANRGNPAWRTNLTATVAGRSNGTLPVPPRTLAAQTALGANSRSPALLQSLNQVRQSGVRLEPVTAAQRSAIVQRAQQLVTQSQQRSRSVTASRDTPAAPRSSGPTTSFKPSPSGATPRNTAAAPSRPAQSATHFTQPATAMPRFSQPTTPPRFGPTATRPPSRSTAPSNPRASKPSSSTPHMSGSPGFSRPSFSTPGHGGAGNTFHGASGFHSSGGYSAPHGSSGGAGHSHSSDNHNNHR